MLILARQLDQIITIGDEIKILVVDIKKNQVRLGIEAPAQVTVHREEIYQQIQQENRKAAQAKKNELLRLTQNWRGMKVK